MRTIYLIAFLLIAMHAVSQVTYPYPSRSILLTIEGKNVQMSYMDIKPAGVASQKNILLLHGKNFNGYYWKELIPYLTGKGYRVIVPDQVGWGKSDRVNIHYSFNLLANNTRLLLQQLGISKTIVLGHSMGGMLATRFALLYPEMTEKLVLENPIGLEDYQDFIPYQSTDSLYIKERSATYESYKKYQQNYYPQWKPGYEQYVQAQAVDLQRSDFNEIAMINAVTFQMIYDQPVSDDFSRLSLPVILIIGQADRTVVGKDKLSQDDKHKYGNYPELGKRTQEKIPGSILITLAGIGHIPHIQDLPAFTKALENILP